MDKAELKALLADLPGMKPPPGVIPNLIDPPTKGNLNLLCHVACISFSTVCVLIRMYTRIFINRAHGWEDCEVEILRLYVGFANRAQILALSHG